MQSIMVSVMLHPKHHSRLIVFPKDLCTEHITRAKTWLMLSSNAYMKEDVRAVLTSKRWRLDGHTMSHFQVYDNGFPWSTVYLCPIYLVSSRRVHTSV